MLLKEILGHENLSTTEIYTHIQSDAAKETIRNNPLSDTPPVELVASLVQNRLTLKAAVLLKEFFLLQ